MLRQYSARQDGSTAIEFSMLFMPFLMLSLAIIELSMMFTSASLLEVATDSASRMIRTGQLQQSGSPNPAEDFRAALCNFNVAIFDCNDAIIEVTALPDFGSAPPVAVDGNGSMQSGGFTLGNASQKVLIRVGYNYQMMTPIVGPLLNGPDGGTQFISTIVMQVEPY